MLTKFKDFIIYLTTIATFLMVVTQENTSGIDKLFLMFMFFCCVCLFLRHTKVGKKVTKFIDNESKKDW